MHTSQQHIKHSFSTIIIKFSNFFQSVTLAHCLKLNHVLDAFKWLLLTHLVQSWFNVEVKTTLATRVTQLMQTACWLLFARTPHQQTTTTIYIVLWLQVLNLYLSSANVIIIPTHDNKSHKIGWITCD